MKGAVKKMENSRKYQENLFYKELQRQSEPDDSPTAKGSAEEVVLEMLRGGYAGLNGHMRGILERVPERRTVGDMVANVILRAKFSDHSANPISDDSGIKSFLHCFLLYFAGERIIHAS